MKRTETAGRKLLLLLMLMAVLLIGSGQKTWAATNEETVFTFLVNEMGFTPAAACGVMGNIYCESNFISDIVGLGNAYGMCQWTDERKSRLQTWCSQHGYNYTTAIGQMHFLRYELQTYFPSVLSYMKTVPNTADGAYKAGYHWCYYFERPANTESASARRGDVARSTYWPKYANAMLYISVKTDIDGNRVNWRASAKYSGYVVRRCTTPGGTYKEVARLSGSSTATYLDKTAKVGTLYYYYVVPLNSRGAEGLKSNKVSCTRKGNMQDTKCTITLSKTSYTYNGKYKRPKITVVYAGNTLVKDTDFTVAYENNVNAGKPVVIVRGKGNYTGEMRIRYRIWKAKQTIKASDMIRGLTDNPLTLRAKASGGGEITCSVEDTSIASASGKTLTLKRCGVTQLTIMAAATENYKSAKMTVKLSVKPAKGEIIKLLNKGNGKLYVSWKLLMRVGGYEIQRSTSKTFDTGHISEYVAGQSIGNTVLKSLQTGRKWYIRVRGYKTIDGKKVFGQWSSIASLVLE